MYDNARKEIKMQIKKKEKTQESVLLALSQRSYIFLARPTHLNPTPRNETPKSAVYQLAPTCTLRRPYFQSRNSTPATLDREGCRFTYRYKMFEKLQTFYDGSKQICIKICRIF